MPLSTRSFRCRAASFLSASSPWLINSLSSASKHRHHWRDLRSRASFSFQRGSQIGAPSNLAPVSPSNVALRYRDLFSRSCASHRSHIAATSPICHHRCPLPRSRLLQQWINYICNKLGAYDIYIYMFQFEVECGDLANVMTYLVFVYIDVQSICLMGNFILSN